MKKKSTLNEKERESSYQTEECSIEEVRQAKYLGLFFSSEWCPPCKNFLNMLKDFYSEVNIDGKECEIMYVSMDKSEDEFRDHYSQMPWLTIPFMDDRIPQLKTRF